LYSAKITEVLVKAGAAPGDTVSVTKAGERTEGILMPRSSLGDRDCLVVKLRSGYNIGVHIEGATVELVEKGKPAGFAPGKGVIAVEKGLPNISVLGCGGTVASRVDYKVGAVFPATTPDELLMSFPELKGLANFKARVLFTLLSGDIAPAHWQAIAKEVAKEIEGGADGVILMHGTDTMGYTAAALSFMLKDLPVPVVMVGAQRSSDRGSSDNQMNMVCAALAAKSDIAEVMVCMHGSSNDDYCLLHQGTKVRKLHTSRRDAFRSVNVKPLARIDYAAKKIESLRTDYRKRDKKRKLALDDKMNPKVGLIQVHPGIAPEFVKKLGEVYEGVVLAGTGLGHIPANPHNDKLAKPILGAVKELVAKGIPVVMAPQTLYGRVNMNVYAYGIVAKEAGVIGDYCDWLPETAMVKLMWVLGHTKEMKAVKEQMEKNVAGEIGERSEVIEE